MNDLDQRTIHAFVWVEAVGTAVGRCVRWRARSVSTRLTHAQLYLSGVVLRMIYFVNPVRRSIAVNDGIFVLRHKSVRFSDLWFLYTLSYRMDAIGAQSAESAVRTAADVAPPVFLSLCVRILKYLQLTKRAQVVVVFLMRVRGAAAGLQMPVCPHVHAHRCPRTSSPAPSS